MERYQVIHGDREKQQISQGRRELIKKAVYVPPMLMVLGLIKPNTGNAVSLGEPPAPPAPQNSPRRRNPGG